jgi:hypothetical protein
LNRLNSRFQKVVVRADSLINLANALSLLSQVRTKETAEMSQAVTHFAATYAKQGQAAIELLLAQEPASHGDTLNRWDSVLIWCMYRASS